MSKTLANEAGTVQFPLVKHATAVGWAVVSDTEALRWRGGEAGLFFYQELEDALLRLNPGIVTPDKAAFHAAIKKMPSVGIEEFNTWPMMNEFRTYHPANGAEISVKPDGFIRFHEKEAGGGTFERTFFLEVDRSTEIQEILITRAACYFEYYKSGGFAVRNGGHRDQYKKFPFRVLMVFKTAERRNNTAERLIHNNSPVLKQVCLATFDEVVNDPLGAIWFYPADYRAATAGTPFAPAPERWAREYRRQTERDHFIEANVKKWRIFSGDAGA